MQIQGFIIYHSDALCRDLAPLYIILPLNAETGLHYIFILLLYVETGPHYISFCCSIQ